MKIKKNCRVALPLLFVIAMSGCSGEEKQLPDTKEITTLAEKESRVPAVVAQEAENFQNTDLPESSPDDGIDVDLTQLSSTMIFSEVYNMMMNPESYEGKTIKMTGQFTAEKAEAGNESGADYYYAVIIADATACCQQGMEFVRDGSHLFPDDYPEIGVNITVTGIFETYKDGEIIYCRLHSAEVESGLR